MFQIFGTRFFLSVEVGGSGDVLSVVHACFVAVIFFEKKLLKNLELSEFITIFAYQIKNKYNIKLLSYGKKN